MTWDVSLVLNVLATQWLNEALSLLALSQKLAILLLLLTSQRRKTIHLLDIRNIVCSGNTLILRFGEKLKTTRPGFYTSEIRLPA